MTLRALEVLERRKRAAPLLYYTPHDKQALFHAARSYRRRMILAGNRWGKTHSGVREVLAHSYGYEFWNVPGLKLDPETGDLPPRDKVPFEYWTMNSQGVPLAVPNEGMCVTGLNTQRGIGQVIWPGLREALPPKLFEEKKIHTTMGPNTCPVRCQLPNGSVIWFGSKEQSRDQWEGFRLHWAWIDEPIPKMVYNGLWRGLADHLGSMWFTLTPLGPDSLWLMDWLEDDSVFKLTGPQRDNTFLAPEVFDEFELHGEYTKREKAARLFGEFEYLGAQVIENFDESVHVVKHHALPEHYILGQTVDPHHKKAAFSLWWGVDPSTEPDFVYEIYKEWPEQDYFKLEGGGMSPTDYAILFRSIEGRRPSDIRVCDPRFGKAEWKPLGDDKNRTVWVQEMDRAGLQYSADVHGVQRLEIGHMKLIEMFRYDRNWPISPTNTPRIFIHDNCHNLIKALKNYSHEETRGKDGDQDKMRVTEKWKDPIDALRYTVLFNIPMLLDSAGGGGGYGQFSDADFKRENQSDFTS
jgi:phage terminase large subunit-like protein